MINDGTVKTPHLLQSTRVNGALVPFKQEESTQIGDIHSGLGNRQRRHVRGGQPSERGRRKYFAGRTL
ncbi:hypothetical protein M8494_37155 [Serratia ureilytica]